MQLEELQVDVRMESWLPTDTIRRAGFGHVIVNRKHLLTLERGVSFVAMGPGGEPVYSSGILRPYPALYRWASAAHDSLARACYR